MRAGIAMLLLNLSVAGLPLSSARADELIVLNKVPLAARRAAQNAAPGVKFAKAVYDESNKHYKLRGSDPKGREVRVLSDERAEFVQVTVSAPTTLKDVPRAVVETRNRTTHTAGRLRFKAIRIVRAERSTAGLDAKTVLYEFIGENAQGELLRQVIREDGVNIGLGDAAD